MSARFRSTRPPEKRLTLSTSTPDASGVSPASEPQTIDRPPGTLLKALLIYALTAIVPWIMLATINNAKMALSSVAIYATGWVLVSFPQLLQRAVSRQSSFL